MKQGFFLVLFILGSLYQQAQDPLSRTAWLGARVEPSEVNGQFAVKIVEPIGGTSKALNMQAGDYLLAINGTAVNDYPQFASELRKYKGGETANLKVVRGKKEMTLKGTFTGKPYETDDNAEVIYDAVDFRGGKLRVIINKPNKQGKLPAMLLVPGYTCSSIDNLDATHPYKRIVDAFVDAGFVTVRVEKSGLGDSQNTPACESCSLTDEIENFEAGLLKLFSLPYVDREKVVIFGHSMGGIVAPALSAKHNVAGVIVFGTTAKSWFEYQLEMYRVQNLLAEMDPLEYEQSVREQYELNYRFFVQKESLAELAKDTAMDRALRTTWEYDGQGRIFSRNAEYWRQIQDMPLLENWKNTSAKVLVEFGESDFQAFSKADHEQLVYTVNHYHPGNAQLKTFPLTDHYFAKSGTMKEAYEKFTTGQYQTLFEEYNPEVGNVSTAWAKQVVEGSLPKSEVKYAWNKLNTEAYQGKQDDIVFVNRNKGWYVNGYGNIYHTQDGGAKWTKQLEKKGTFFRCISFVDENIGFAGTVGTEYFPNVTDTIPLYGTKDGGKTWAPVEYKGPYVKGLCALDVVKEQFIDRGNIGYKTHIYGVGRVGAPANWMYSGDDGKSWVSKSMDEDCKMLFDIKMLDKETGFACAATSEDIAQSHALILKTTDGGKSWRKVYESTRPFETTWKASFPSREVGYVTIQSYNPDTNVKQQRVAKTTDGGETWVELPLVEDAGAREFGVGFFTPDHGFVGTMNNGFETKDGGKTWEKVDLGRACNKIRVYNDEQGSYGYAIGVNVYKWEIEK